MIPRQWVRGALALFTATVFVVGCGKSDDKGTSGKEKDSRTVASPKHDGWWCKEHGIPEAECSMCLPDAEVKTRFKDKGDWCDKHDRAKSQCFICDPSLREKYAARYRAKYGKEPPEPKDNMPAPEEKK